MNDTPDISTKAETAPAEGGASKPGAAFDDVMLSMDIVDTLRHREAIAEAELNEPTREAALIERLREIYRNQGIEVPDHILRDGVRAMKEQRFVYRPPRPGLQVTLAKIYVARSEWWKPVAGAFAAIAFLFGAWHVGIERPREARLAAQQVELTDTIPAELGRLVDGVREISRDSEATARAEALGRDGLEAAGAGDLAAARAHLDQLSRLYGLLRADLTVRVVNERGENSGVWRYPEDDPSIRNYYLIVEALDAQGDPFGLDLESEEDRVRKNVARWGVRVPYEVFDAVAADKGDDFIIQNDVVGRKPRGEAAIDYLVETDGGVIFTW